MKPGLLGAVIAATAVAATVVAPQSAEARGLHIRAGGHVHLSGGVYVRVGSPPPPPPPVYYYESQPTYYPAYPPQYAPAPAPAVVQVAEPPRRGILGLGLNVSSIGVGNDNGDTDLHGEGIGLIGRLHLSPRFELELNLAQNRFYDNPRVDSRLGADGIFLLGEPGGFTPYLLLGAGFNVIDPLGNAQETGNDEHLPVQGYVEAGVGIEWAIVPHLALSTDLRLQGRRLDEESVKDSKLASGTTTIAQKEDALEGRVNLIFYF
jgi:hypothetical protein